MLLIITKSCSIVVEPHWAAGRVGSLAATLSGSDSLEVFLGSTIALLVAARAFTKRLSRLIGWEERSFWVNSDSWSTASINTTATARAELLVHADLSTGAWRSEVATQTWDFMTDTIPRLRGVPSMLIRYSSRFGLSISRTSLLVLNNLLLFANSAYVMRWAFTWLYGRVSSSYMLNILVCSCVCTIWLGTSIFVHFTVKKG